MANTTKFTTNDIQQEGEVSPEAEQAEQQIEQISDSTHFGTDSSQLQSLQLEKTFVSGVQRDTADVERCMERERRFQVQWNLMSRNKLWLKEEQAGPPVVVYEASPEEYRGEMGKEIWPRGRNLDELSIYGQIWDFFRFMWAHTKPYSTVFMIVTMAFFRPVQTAVISYVAQQIEANPTAVPLWLYLMGFFVEIISRFLYWWYEMWVPLNSQRVQMRSVLLTKRTALPDAHPLAVKWPSGRFTALLKDVDDVINGIWKSLLSFFDDFVTIIWLLILCFSNLAVASSSATNNLTGADYGTYVAVFLALGIVTMGGPFIWFNMLYGKVQECETMVREGQAVYMSVSGDAVVMASEIPLAKHMNIPDTAADSITKDDTAKAKGPDSLGRKAYWVYGRTTFRSFFHRLAWTTNFSILAKLWTALAAYGLLTSSGFGGGNLTSILIVLISLNDLAKLSPQLLDKLILMSRGCHVLRDVAELLNTDIGIDNYKSSTDIESGRRDDNRASM